MVEGPEVSESGHQRSGGDFRATGAQSVRREHKDEMNWEAGGK